MKKNALKILIPFLFTALIFSNIKPVIGLRMNDVVTNNDLATLVPALTLGFASEVNDGVVAGFDSDGEDSRIFVAFDYGTLGMGINANGDPQFTVGAAYKALPNLGVSLDYVVNNLSTDGDDGGPSANVLRLSLDVTF